MQNTFESTDRVRREKKRRDPSSEYEGALATSQTRDAETEAGASGAQTSLADYSPISIFPTLSKYNGTIVKL